MLRGRRRKSAISMYRHRRGPVWSPKGSLALILPSIAGPLPLTWPRMAMPFGGHTGPRLIGNGDTI